LFGGEETQVPDVEGSGFVEQNSLLLSVELKAREGDEGQLDSKGREGGEESGWTYA